MEIHLWRKAGVESRLGGECRRIEHARTESLQGGLGDAPHRGRRDRPRYGDRCPRWQQRLHRLVVPASLRLGGLLRGAPPVTRTTVAGGSPPPRTRGRWIVGTGPTPWSWKRSSRRPRVRSHRRLHAAPGRVGGLL